MTMDKNVAKAIFDAKISLDDYETKKQIPSFYVESALAAFPKNCLCEIFVDYIFDDEINSWKKIATFDYDENSFKGNASFSNRELTLYILTSGLLLKDKFHHDTKHPDSFIDEQIKRFLKYIPDKSQCVSIIYPLEFLIKHSVSWRYIADKLSECIEKNGNNTDIYYSIYKAFKIFSESVQENDNKLLEDFLRSLAPEIRVNMLYMLIYTLVDWKFIARIKYGDM